MLYSAHMLFVFQRRSGEQTEWMVQENIVLFSVMDDSLVFSTAEQFANDHYRHDDSSLTLDGIPVMKLYKGIRKIVRAEHDLGFPSEFAGIEISYSEYLVSSLEELRCLVDGEDAAVTYLSMPPRPSTRG